jgi:hypothetical protein
MSVPADESGIPVDGVDPHEDILRLESEIEKLGETLEGCRKIILISKIAMAAGAVALLGLLFGLLTFDLLVMVSSFTAVIGGIVAYGSNISTAQQTAEALKDAEARRAELIDGSDLRLVGNGAGGALPARLH